ncbi:MAG: TRAM domain-containing protein [Acidobacteria bacterium]|nr:TRAM domain-containing protein [Acidobacteriota bacterium]
MLTPGDTVLLTPEKPAAGGRMLARHDGLIVLVSGAIPGEPVRARIERVERSLAYAEVVDVVHAHPARRPVEIDPRCGGLVYAHIGYDEQVRLKGEVIRDALARLGRVPASDPIPVTPSPERGYRMRARLHVRGGLVGFFLEGTHTLCDAGLTGQLLPDAVRAVHLVAGDLDAAGLSGDADIELAENRAGDERALHIEISPDASLAAPQALRPVPGVTGLSWSQADARREQRVFGEPFVTDTLGSVGLRRHARAFFQGNRFLLEILTQTVIEACPDGPVVDLYAGVGLFGVCLASTGRHTVVAVEGHAASVADLRENARPHGNAVTVVHEPVERFVARAMPGGPFTLVLDPPRSGMTKEAATGAVRLGASRVVFVSCDVATFARDVRRFVDAGYRLESVRGFDLFPTTAHVEAVGILTR